MKPPPEYIKYKYRRLFHLTSHEYEQEPIDELFTNLLIYGYIEDMKNIEYEKAKK